MYPFLFVTLFCLVADERSITKVEVVIAQGSEPVRLLTVNNQDEEEEILEDGSMLMKLKRILSPGLKNQTSSSSSSESSSSAASFKSGRSSSMSQSSSSSESLESSSSSSQSSSSSSSESSLHTSVSQSFFKYATMKNQKV